MWSLGCWSWIAADLLHLHKYLCVWQPFLQQLTFRFNSTWTRWHNNCPTTGSSDTLVAWQQCLHWDNSRLTWQHNYSSDPVSSPAAVYWNFLTSFVDCWWNYASGNFCLPWPPVICLWILSEIWNVIEILAVFCGFVFWVWYYASSILLFYGCYFSCAVDTRSGSELDHFKMQQKSYEQQAHRSNSTKSQ
jgi:hypothetical protein